MAPLELTLRLAAGLVLILLNAFFVATEFALTRVRQFPAEAFQGDARLRLAWRMTERLEIYLTGCQLGITSTSILLGVVAEPGVTFLLRPLWDLLGLAPGTTAVASVVTAVVALNLVHKIWGEQAPTYLGVERPRAVARWTARPHYWWTKVMYPVIILGDGLAKLTLRLFGVEMRRSWIREEEAEEDETERPTSRADVRRAMGEILARGDVTAEQREEVLAAFETGTLPVRKVMVPRDGIVALRVDAALDEHLERIGDAQHTRYPLVADSLDDVRGTIYAPAMLAALDRLRKGDITLADLAAPALSVPPGQSVNELVDVLQEHEQELALVKEDGRVVGLVTVTDAFEAIVGELRDPFD